MSADAPVGGIAMRRFLAMQLGLIFTVSMAAGQTDIQPPPGVRVVIGSAEADAIGAKGARQRVGVGRIIIEAADTATGEAFQQQQFPGNTSVWLVETEEQAKQELTTLFNEAHKNERIVPGTLRISFGPYRKGSMIERIGDFARKYTPVMIGRAATKAHVLLVCDTDAHRIGPGVQVNGRRMERFFADAFRGRENILALTIYSGNNVTPSKILDYYRNLNSQPTESLVFYYGGHGGSVNTGRGFEHYMATTHGGTLWRSQLRDEMQRRPHQCVILLTDCCSNETTVSDADMQKYREDCSNLFGKPVRGRLGDVFGRRVSIPARIDQRSVDSLLLHHEGTIDLTAATPSRDQFSWTDIRPNGYGGFFTYALVGVLSSDVNSINTGRGRIPGVVNWEQAFYKIQPWAAALSLGRPNLPPAADLKAAPPRERDRIWQWAYAFSFH